jgi:ribose 5-phosphate isomerase A
MSSIPHSSDKDAQKRAAAVRAVDFIKDGMKLGLGTGSTAEAFLEALVPRLRAGLSVVGTPTSERTAEKARALGIPLEELDTLGTLDITIDGADEADHALNLIKGGGGALLREKIVAASSKQMIVIADAAKLVQRLGAFPLPVEVVTFGHATTVRRIKAVAHAFGYPHMEPVLRMKDYAPYRSDNGNYIYDCPLGPMNDAPSLAVALSTVPGVVDHGLFIGIATTLILGEEGGGARVIEAKR